MPQIAIRIACALASLLAFRASGAGAASATPATGEVRTIAGGGPSGLADGVGRAARFMQPTGIAVAPDGTTYVSDATAQRIRAIARDGTVTTLAGGGTPDATGLYVAGAYRDGPGAEARFNVPQGVAVGRDGALYIADKLNHCIRRYASGTVSTFAGSPDRPGSDDGPPGTARFRYPSAIAFDAAGTAFVADFGVGVRTIAPDGTVKTLRTPSIDPTVTGVSIGADADRETLFVADGKPGMGLYDLATGESRFELALEGDGGFGTPLAVRALSPYDAVFVDARSHTVRYFRGPRLPQLSRSLVHIVAGGHSEAPELNAGDVDGPPAAARFDAPAGIDLAPNGTYLVADARNRAVRSVPPVDRRGPVIEFSDFDAPGTQYRIAYLSASIAFWDSLWPDSVAGILERRLAADAPRVGLSRTPHVYAIRLDGSSTRAIRNYAEQLLSQGVVDLVVLNYGIAFVNLDVAQDAKLADATSWGAYVSDQLRGMQQSLASAGVKFVVAQLPVWSNASPSEMLFAREVYVAKDYDPNFATADALRRAIRASGVPTLDLTGEIWDYERRPDRGPLFQTDGPHQTPLGNRMTADAIASYLEKLRPWSTP